MAPETAIAELLAVVVAIKPAIASAADDPAAAAMLAAEL
jgi:hypothetical protein